MIEEERQSGERPEEKTDSQQKPMTWNDLKNISWNEATKEKK